MDRNAFTMGVVAIVGGNHCFIIVTQRPESPCVIHMSRFNADDNLALSDRLQLFTTR